MDYEKKYKQLHTLISDLYSFMPEYCKEKVEGFFPEFKESEDEMIRKKIIALFKGQIPFTSGEDNKKFVAWLERQGESYTKRDVDDAYVEGMAFAKDELEKQGEPSIKWNKNTEGNKPQVNHSVLMKTFQGIAEGEWKGEYWLQYRWAGIVRDSDVLSWIELSDLEKQDEQKPAWSEDDEVYLNAAIAYFKDAHEFKKTAEICLDWLNSLKQRIGGKQ